LTATDDNGCQVQATALIEAGTQLHPRITAPNGLVLCADESLLLDGGSEYVSWRWSTGDTTRYCSVSDTGMYFVDVATHGGCMGRSNTVCVTRETLAETDIDLGGEPWLCPGDSLVLTAQVANAQYYWSTGERTRSITVRSGGVYAVTYVTPGGCENSSEPVHVLMRQEMTPVITRSEDFLHASGGVLAYQWFRNDAAIPGKTGPSLQLTQTGRFIVEVIDSCGRRLRSDELLVTTLAILTPVASEPHLELYPDPVSEFLHLRFEGRGELRSIEVRDVLGRMLFSLPTLRGKSHRIDLSSVSPGVYLLHVEYEDGYLIRRILKQSSK
jgi:hypothetical protein